MSTINREFLEQGYCENINQNRYIKIRYVSVPSSDSERQEFMKIKNACIDLREGKCDKGDNCAIFKKANEIKDISEI